MNKGTMQILLIYPGERVMKPRLPMAVLTIATHCIAEGFKCRIVDERVEELSDEDIISADVIGISTMSGAQLKASIKTAKRIREIRTDVPLVWGGAHPSAYSVQSAESDLVDYVIKAEGEQAFIDLCLRLLKGGDHEDIPALTFKREDGRMVNNPVSNSWMNMDDLHFPEYRLLDIKKYADHDDGLSYETSRGCPFRCTFCYVEYFHNRQWRGKSAKKVVGDLKRIKKEIGVKKMFFIDDNFFGSKKRSMEICSEMIEAGLSMKWSATIRADLLSKYTDEEMRLIKESGCEILAIGAESGSERVLKKIKKDITPGQVKRSVAKCAENGIMPQVSFVIGFPFEEEEDLEKTIRFYDELMGCGKNIEINGLFIYMPYVGTQMFDIAVEHGYKPCKTLEEWGDWNFSTADNNPWISGKKRKRMETISSIARFKYLYHRFEYYSEEYRKQKLRSPLVKLGYHVGVKLFAKIADIRWKYMYFDFAVEWKLWRFLAFKIFKVN